jgi:hypothetical protein
MTFVDSELLLEEDLTFPPITSYGAKSIQKPGEE